MTTTIAAQAADNPGWGKLIALILTALVFWAGTSAHKRWRQVKTVDLHSPDQGQKVLVAVKPQLSGDVDSEDQGPGSGGGEVVPLRRKPVDEFVAARDGKQPPTAIVREATQQLKVSPATAWRALRNLRRGNGGAA